MCSGMVFMRAASAMCCRMRSTAASRTSGSGLVNDSRSSIHACPVLITGQTRPCRASIASSSAASIACGSRIPSSTPS